MSRRGLSLFVLVFLPVAGGSAGARPASEHPVQADLKGLGQSLERERRLLQRLKDRSVSLLETLSKMDRRIATAEAELREFERGEESLLAKLSEHQIQREQAARSLEASRERLRVRLRALYKMGEFGWLNLVLDAKSVAEGLERFRLLQRLTYSDRALIARTTRWRELLEVSERRMKEQTARLQTLAEQVHRRKQRTERAREARRRALDLVQQEETLHRKALAEMERARWRLGQVVSSLGGRSSTSKGFLSWRGRLAPPVEGARIEEPFGRRVDPRFKTVTIHQGLDIRAEKGINVKTVYPGLVVFAEPFEGYGLMVIIDHGGGYYTLYAHLGRLLVAKGDQVALEQPVGTLGETGSLKGPYLYFEVRERGRAVDPANWVRFY